MYNLRMRKVTKRKTSIAPGFADKKDAWTTFVEGHGRHRLTFEGKGRILPELHLLGWLKFRQAMANALWPSQHHGLYEIHCIAHGKLHWWVEQQDYLLGPGAILVIRPGELHGASHGVLDPCEHYWMQLDVGIGKRLPALSAKLSQEMISCLEGRSSRALAGGEPARDAFERLVEEHRNPGRFSLALARGVLHELLTIICRAPTLEDSQESASSHTEQGIWRAIQEIRENLASPPSVARLAALLGVSEPTLRSEFRRKTGLTPLEFVTSLRIEKARMMLRGTDMDITQIAGHIGFSSSQYFATVFLKKTGQTPRDYRKSVDPAWLD
jgi:AraC-like DNA-binding protein